MKNQTYILELETVEKKIIFSQETKWGNKKLKHFLKPKLHLSIRNLNRGP